MGVELETKIGKYVHTIVFDKYFEISVCEISRVD